MHGEAVHDACLSCLSEMVRIFQSYAKHRKKGALSGFFLLDYIKAGINHKPVNMNWLSGCHLVAQHYLSVF